MPSRNHRICRDNIFRFAGMEARARNFILDKAVGLLQNFKSKLPQKTSSDIQSGLSNATQHPTVDDRFQHFPGCRGCDRTPGDLGGDDNQDRHSEQGVNQKPQSMILPSKGPLEQGFNQQPQLTEGPARFVIANDGSKDCMALLVTDGLIAKLRDLYEDDHHLSGKRGPLDYARREARSLEISTDQIKESVEVAGTPENVGELQEMVRRQEPQLLKVLQRRDELEKGVQELERNVTSSKSNVQWILHTAMKEAHLLEPHRPLTPVSMADGENGTGAQEKIDHNTYNENGTENGGPIAVEHVTDCVDSPEQHSVILANTDDVSEDLQLLRRAAWESFNETLVTMHKVQTLFDNRQQSYETDLADYEQGFANGIYCISRSEFDRSKIRYGQKVTRALINAEEAFEAAKEQAQTVGAIGSDYDDAIDCYGCYEESWPESQLASYLAMKDWDHVDSWLANFPEPSGPAELEPGPPEVDDWYADEVDPADSISQVDFDESRKDIDRWENIRFDRWEEMRTRVGGPGVQVGFLVRSVENLNRRHSVSLCRADGDEWEPCTQAL